MAIHTYGYANPLNAANRYHVKKDATETKDL
jgi:hypothetical protein